MATNDGVQRFFMPSEIARLVLGYLKDVGCLSGYRAFLEESPHLREYKECLSQGYEYPTEIGGQSLVHILNNKHKAQSAPTQPTQASSTATGCSHWVAPKTDDLQPLNQKLDTLLDYLVTDRRVSTAASSSAGCAPLTASTPVPREAEHQFKTPVKEPPVRVHPHHHHGYASPFKVPPASPSNRSGSNVRVTPRKSLTPRKRNLIEEPQPSDHPTELQSTTSIDPNSSQMTLDCDSTLTATPSKQKAPNIEPSVIVGQFMNNPLMSDLLAETMNRVLNGGSTPLPGIADGTETNANLALNLDHNFSCNPIQMPTTSTSQSMSQERESQAMAGEENDEANEIHIPEDAVAHILNDLEELPAYREFLFGIAEMADISPSSSSYAMTPSTGVPTPGECSVSSPIVTPCKSSPVGDKDLMSDLKTPDKRFASSPFASSPFVAPSFCEDASSPFNFLTPIKLVVPDFNILTSSPHDLYISTPSSSFMPLILPISPKASITTVAPSMVTSLSVPPANVPSPAILVPSKSQVNAKRPTDAALNQAKAALRPSRSKGKRLKNIFECNSLKRKSEIQCLVSTKKKIAPKEPTVVDKITPAIEKITPVIEKITPAPPAPAATFKPLAIVRNPGSMSSAAASKTAVKTEVDVLTPQRVSRFSQMRVARHLDFVCSQEENKQRSINNPAETDRLTQRAITLKGGDDYTKVKIVNSKSEVIDHKTAKLLKKMDTSRMERLLGRFHEKRSEDVEQKKMGN